MPHTTPPRTIPDATLWMLPIPVTLQAVADIARAAHARTVVQRPRLVMHSRTLHGIAAAHERERGMTISRSQIEHALTIRIETDLMYPDGLIHATD